MANKKYEEAHIQAIASAIRENIGTEQTYTVSDMASGVSEVYEAGEEAGYNAGYYDGEIDGWIDGVDDYYNTFWERYQQKGERTDYYAGFAGEGWTRETFKPVYDIKPSGSAYGIFQKSRISGDLVQYAKDSDFEIDFSNTTILQYGFSNTSFTRIGVIDCSNTDSMIRAFETNPTLKTIDKIILKQDGNTNLTNTFNQCTALEEIRFEGVIGTSVSFSSSPLSVESMKSIISCLKDYSGTDNEFIYTLTLSSVSKTALESEGATSPNGNTWSQYVDDLGWTLK